MQKFTKIALATLIAMTAVAGVGCSSKNDTPAATTPATTDKKDDTEKTNRAVFAAALIADEKLANQFKPAKGLGADGKDTSYNTPKGTKADAVKFLSTYWSDAAAGKEFDAILGDAAYLANVNKEVEAAVNKGNEGKADDKKAKFTALTAVADSAKFKKNDLSGAAAQFKDAKIESKDGKFTLDYKGLKYTLEKAGTSYKVVGKEGTLTK